MVWVIRMAYQVWLSSCSRYVCFRTSDFSGSGEQISARLKALGDFARRNETHRILIDWRDDPLPVDHKLADALLQKREIMERNARRFALLYTANAPANSIETVAELAAILQRMGQHAEVFFNHDKAVAWLVADQE
jgi:hypothetical protein